MVSYSGHFNYLKLFKSKAHQIIHKYFTHEKFTKVFLCEGDCKVALKALSRKVLQIVSFKRD